MFVLSGVMVVIAFTLIIVYNARLLTVIFQRDAAARYARHRRPHGADRRLLRRRLRHG